MRKLLSFLIALAAIVLGVCSPAFADSCSRAFGYQGGTGCNSAIGGGVSGGLPLDGISTGIKAAYSTRQLLTAYAGSAMQVKRASDSTTSNIGFSANVLNTSALGTFCSGTTCTVTIWYDQSGGGYNLTPGTAPVIYQSGAVTAINGKPAPLFSSSYLTNASLSVNPVNTLYQNAVVQVTTFNYGAITGPSGVQALELRVDTTTGVLDLFSASVAPIGASSNSLTAGVGAVAEVQYNSSTGTYSFWINRASGGTGSSAQSLSAANFELGGYSPGGEYLIGYIGECISYDLVGGIPGASQTSIENNQKAYWGTP